MASVRKREGRWYARMPGRGGKEYALPEAVRAKSEALRLAHELELRDWRIEQGLQAPPSPETVAEAWERYLHAIRKHRSISSISSRWRQHILPALGRVPYQQVRPTQIEALLDSLDDAGYGGWTRRHVRNHLSAFYRWLKKDGKVDASPLERVKAVARPKAEPKAVPLEEVQRIAGHATFPGLRYLILLLFYTASRPGAMIAARKEHVDWGPPARLHFPETKGGKPHTVRLVAPAVALLQDLFHAVPGQHLFLTSRGTPLTLRRAERAFKVALKRAGVGGGWEAVCRRKRCGFKEARKPEQGERCPRCKFTLWAKALPSPLCLKDMRSSLATHLIDHLPPEVGMRTAQAHLGHSPGSKVTATHYVAGPEEEAVAAALAQAFAEEAEPTKH